MPEPAGETRVVLVKPGDVLLIGGVHGGWDESVGSAMATLSSWTGVRVAFFADDITIGSAPGEQVPHA